MFIYLLHLLTGMLGLVVLIVIQLQFKKNRLVNKYLQVVIAAVTIKFTINGVSPFILKFSAEDFNLYLDMTLTLIIPSYYLYFKDLAKEVEWKISDLKHLAFTLTSFFFFILFEHTDAKYTWMFKQISSSIALIFCFVYAYAGFIFLKKNIWIKKSELKTVEAHNRVILNWTYLLFTCFILFIIRYSYNFFNSGLVYSKATAYQNLWISSIIWLIIFFKLLITPEILYGFNFLEKQFDELKLKKIALPDLWNIKELQPISNQKDKKLAEKISTSLALYIQKIENLSLSENYFRNTEATLEDLARDVNIPVSHIVYLFKYHCKESFSDYKKIFRIQDSIQLIRIGYLNSNTIESIAAKVGFSSYSTFFNSFKSITGFSPFDFNAMLNNITKETKG